MPDTPHALNINAPHPPAHTLKSKSSDSLKADATALLPSSGRTASDRSTPANNPKLDNKYRQVARIIRHLREDLKAVYPAVALPTGWMIDNLIFNCPADAYRLHCPLPPPGSNSAQRTECDWNALVVSALEHIKERTATTAPCDFTQEDGITPLFPNHELFDEQDAYNFSSTLLQHLHNCLELDSQNN